MGPVLYGLCNNQVTGLFIWITGMCAFPNLIEPTDVSLQKTGLVLEREFKAPVDKPYLLYINFIFSSDEDRLKDQLVGDGRQSPYCDGNVEYDTIPPGNRAGLGLPLSFRVVVRRQPGGETVADQTFHTLCETSFGSRDKGRDIGRIPLTIGSYRIQVHNLQAQSAFKDLQSQISFVSGGRK